MGCFNVDDIVEVIGCSRSNSTRDFLNQIGKIANVVNDYGTIRYAVEFEAEIRLSHSCRHRGVDMVPSGKGQWLVAEDLRLIQNNIPNLDMSCLL